MRALIVGNDIPCRQAVAALLRSMGFEVSAVRSACEARWLLSMSSPEVVVLNLRLPGGSGVEVLQFVRQLDLPVSVALIAATNDPKLMEAIKLRPETVLAHPLELGALRGWLSRALERDSQERWTPTETP